MNAKILMFQVEFDIGGVIVHPGANLSMTSKSGILMKFHRVPPLTDPYLPPWMGISVVFE